MTWAEAVAAGRAPGYWPVHPHWTAVPEWVTGYEIDRLLDLRMIRVRLFWDEPVMEWRMRRPADGA